MVTRFFSRQLQAQQRQKGSAILTFVVTLALIIVLVGAGYLTYTLYIGANVELKNAATAGALNIAKKVPTGINCPLNMNDPYEKQLAAYADKINGQPMANLQNYNKIEEYVSKVCMRTIMLAKLHPGVDQGYYENARHMADAANNIAQRLAAQINTDAADPNGLIAKYFNDVFNANSHHMLAAMNKGTTHVALTIMPAYTNQGKASEVALNNVFANPPSLALQINDNVQIPGTTLNQCVANGIPGYVPIHLSNVDRTLWFLPFTPRQGPRLVSASAYASSKNPPGNMTSNCPLPDAFLITPVVTIAPIQSEQASASSIAPTKIALSPILVTAGPNVGQAKSLSSPITNEFIRIYNNKAIAFNGTVTMKYYYTPTNPTTYQVPFSFPNLSAIEYVNAQLLINHMANNDPAPIYSNSNQSAGPVNTLSGWVNIPASRLPLTLGTVQFTQPYTVGQALTQVHTLEIGRNQVAHYQLALWPLPNFSCTMYDMEFLLFILMGEPNVNANLFYSTYPNVPQYQSVLNLLLNDPTPFPQGVDIYIYADPNNSNGFSVKAINDPNIPSWITADVQNHFLANGFLDNTFFTPVANNYSNYTWNSGSSIDNVNESADYRSYYFPTIIGSGSTHGANGGSLLQNMPNDWGYGNIGLNQSPYKNEPSFNQVDYIWELFQSPGSSYTCQQEVVLQSFIYNPAHPQPSMLNNPCNSTNTNYTVKQ